MSLFILGTGRSGTMSAAAYFGGAHEPSSEIIIPAAAYHTAGLIPVEEAAALIEYADLPEVSSHYRYAELIPAIRLADPDAEFLWVRRDREDTVRSMVRKGWYSPRWDDLWPVQWTNWTVTDGRPGITFRLNHEAFRANPVILGLVPWSEWKAWPQENRCRWWVGYCELLCSGLKAVDLEDSGFPVLNSGTLHA